MVNIQGTEGYISLGLERWGGYVIGQVDRSVTRQNQYGPRVTRRQDLMTVSRSDRRRQTDHDNTDGALDRGSPCRLSIIRNANVACFCRLFMAMSHVEFTIYPCHMSLYFPKPYRMSVGFMSYVEFKKWSCRPVEFKSQGPY